MADPAPDPAPSPEDTLEALAQSSWLSDALAVDRLLDGPVAARAVANLRKFNELSPWEPEASLVHLERAWILGRRDPAILKQVQGGMRSVQALVRLLTYHRERVYLAARARDVEAFVPALYDLHLFCVRGRLAVQDAALAAFVGDLMGPLRRPPRRSAGPRTRLCYVVPFAELADSTLPPIPFEMAPMHDRSRFDVAIFVPDTEARIRELNPALLPLTEGVRAEGIDVTFATVPADQRDLACLLSWRDQLEAIRADALVFMLQTYQPMLLAALRPAPLMVGWDMGNPDWYSSPFLDVCFAGHPHATMEARCESVYLPLGMTRDHAAHGGDLTRADLGIPADGPLLMTSGSPDKLGGPVMWQGLRRLLEGHPGRLLVLGPTPEQVAPHQKDWDAALRDRCHVVPRRPDFAAVMGVCDVYVDTVPVGGGFAVMEAMRQDKPCVLVHHDLGRIFDKRANYNTMSCYGLDPEIAVPANDRDAFVRRGLDLLGSAEARQRQIERQRAVIPTMTQPYARMPLFEAEVLKRLAAAS